MYSTANSTVLTVYTPKCTQTFTLFFQFQWCSNQICAIYTFCQATVCLKTAHPHATPLKKLSQISQISTSFLNCCQLYIFDSLYTKPYTNVHTIDSIPTVSEPNLCDSYFWTSVHLFEDWSCIQTRCKTTLTLENIG